LRKAIGSQLDAATLVAVFSLGQVPLFALWWTFDPGGVDHTNYWAPSLLSLVLNIGANLLFVRSVQVSELSRVVPLLSFTPVFSTALAIPLLGELPSILQGTGIAVVVIGALVLGRSGSATAPAEQAPWRDPGAWMMMGVALCWSFTTVLDKSATQHAPPAFHGLVQTGVMGLCLAIVVRLRARPTPAAVIRAEAGRLALTTLVAAAAFGLQLIALGGMGAGLVETQKRIIGLLMAMLFGRMFFAEAIDRSKLIGIAILGLGTIMTVLGTAPDL
jgi:drug/metabolite transporter (DMT)-like permease